MRETGAVSAAAAGASPRELTLADFADYLRTTNNRNGRPFEEATASNYVYAARALDAWMTAQGIDGDFTVADTAMLNRFLRDYFRRHGQGGTHSQQRNLRHLFTYLQREHGHAHPHTDSLHRYAEPAGRRLATLSAEFIRCGSLAGGQCCTGMAVLLRRCVQTLTARIPCAASRSSSDQAQLRISDS